MSITIEEIPWRLPWTPLQPGVELSGVQKELQKEIGPKHPLWNKNVYVIARRVDSDDILAHLSDDSLAVVHLVWHGRIDTIPDKYPMTTIFKTIAAFLIKMEHDAVSYSE